MLALNAKKGKESKRLRNSRGREPLEGTGNRGVQSKTYIDTLLRDAGVETTSELRSLLEDRKEWKSIVASAGRPEARATKIDR